MDIEDWKNRDKKRYDTPWKNWIFENGLLWDADGNHYSQDDIIKSWMVQSQIHNDLGSPSQILHLKKRLEQRAALLSPPKIILKWDSPEGEITKSFQVVN